jgi:tRNA(Arg) A34 adenosine deaminase TadA
MNQTQLIEQTYRLALEAQNKGNHPFGALLVMDDNVVLTSKNSVVTDKDITQHAELRLISQASKQFTKDQLAKASLFTSTEPCAMCSGAIFWSGISQIFYGCSATKLAEFSGGSFVVPCRELLKFGKRKIDVTGPILEEIGAKIHSSFWTSINKSKGQYR